MYSTRAIVISLSLLVMIFTLAPAPGAWAGAPTDQFRDGVDQVFKILRDPALRGDTKAGERRTAIARAAAAIFDFGETAKRSLGQHWEQRSPAEREEFVRLFTELVQRSYVSRVDKYGSEKMIFRGDTVDGGQAVVRTVLVFDNGGQMPLDYKMHSTGDRWRVYDLSVDGISLVANYRAQFNKIIRTASYDALVARLKSRETQFSEPSAPTAAKATR